MNDNQQKLVRLATKILLKALKTFYKEYLEQEHSNKKEKHLISDIYNSELTTIKIPKKKQEF